MNSSNKSILENKLGNEQAQVFKIGLKGRKPGSNYAKFNKKYGEIVNKIYSLIEADQDYFNGVFIFFASVIKPVIQAEHRMQKISYDSLKFYIESLEVDESEIEKQLEIFESILKMNDSDYSDFRGFFLEEFLSRKLEENCGVFEKVACEEVIEPINCEEFTGFTSGADVDVLKFESSSQISDSNVLKNIVKFDCFECKANVYNYMINVYRHSPTNSKKAKILHMTEIESLISNLYPDSINKLHVVGYESLSSEELSEITLEINRIRHKKRYSLDFLNSLLKIKGLFAQKRFLMMGRLEINNLFYV